MENICERIREGLEVRANLIQARQKLKIAESRETIRNFFEKETGLLGELLRHEDPKVRKNAALLIGDLKLQACMPGLFEAYQQEETLFVRGDYLKAMESLDIAGYEEELQQRLTELSSREILEEEQKHYREELNRLQRLALRGKPKDTHSFVGHRERYDLLLTTNRNYREITARQVKGGKASLVSLGVRVRKAELSEIFKIPTFREMLFFLNVSTVPKDPIEAGKMLASSDLQELLKKGHGDYEVFRFRITIVGNVPLDQRSSFIKKCSFALEQQTGRRLINSASDYEMELKLMKRKDGAFLPLVKLHTLKDPRFSYRKQSIAASIHPSDAALIAALGRPYFKENAQVLDPFCGVGTMLLERERAVKAGPMYGIDIFGEAIAKARENTALTDKEIYYINRDFFDFTHEYLFDEIFTNMPMRGKKTRQEQELLYQRFFEKAEKVLKPEGVMILYSNEKGYIKKELRLREGWKLLSEFCLNEKEEFSVFVIGRRK